jgi:enhancing lycopene biosynthesis protein 2
MAETLPVAVVLCGSGRADGSEITEAVSTLIHLSRVGLPYRCYAPDGPQAEVVNHLTGKPAPESRNMLTEAARIARGEIASITTLHTSDHCAVIFPGGFGAAKNLCTFAKDGPDCTVHPQVERVIKEFHAARKPIGLISIAPVLAAKVLGTAAGATAPSPSVRRRNRPGHRHHGRPYNRQEGPQAHTDDTHRIITTPAYMCDAKPHEVFDGIGELVLANYGPWRLERTHPYPVPLWYPAIPMQPRPHATTSSPPLRAAERRARRCGVVHARRARRGARAHAACHPLLPQRRCRGPAVRLTCQPRWPARRQRLGPAV